MEVDEDTIGDLLAAVASDGYDLHAPGYDPSQRHDPLAVLAAAGPALADVELTAAHGALVLRLLSRLVARADLDASPPPLRVQHAYSVVAATLGNVPADAPALAAALGGAAFYEALLARAVLVSEAALRVPRANAAAGGDAHSLGGVTFTTTGDAVQPKSGSILALQAEAAPARDAAASAAQATTLVRPATAAAAAVKASGAGVRPAAAAARARAEPPFNELTSLRSLLYWALARGDGGGACRAAGLSALHAFLLSYTQGCAKDPSSAKYATAAVRAGLQVVLAALRGSVAAAAASSQRRDDGSAMDVDGPSPPTPADDDGCPTRLQWLDALLPLHDAPGSLVEGVAAVLSAFHEPLAQCVFLLLTAAQPPGVPLEAVLSRLCGALAAGWAESLRGNTPKGVLLLSELEQVVTRLPQAVAAAAAAAAPGAGAATSATAAGDAAEDEEQRLLRSVVLPAAGGMVCDALASDNSRVAQVGMGLFRRPAFLRAVVGAAEAERASAPAGGSLPLFQRVLLALLRDGQPHWNTTVNRQTLLVLNALEAAAPALLRDALVRLWEVGGGGGAEPAAPAAAAAAPALPLMPAHGLLLPKPATGVSDGAAAAATAVPRPTAAAPRSQPLLPPSTRLPAHDVGVHAGGWRGANPPLTITGVAPWAIPVGVGGAALLDPVFAGAAAASGGGARRRPDPPLTITGVAPWAVGATPAVLGPPLGHGSGSRPPQLPLPGEPVKASLRPASVPLPSAQAASQQPPPRTAAVAAPAPPTSSEGDAGMPPWRARYARYLARLQPPPPPAAAEAAPDAAVPGELPPVLARRPVSLPSLGFHDLVFGAELGSGSFSVVRYAKRIVRGAPGSSWPEYAVKVVSSSTLAALGYEPSVRREVAVLRALSHPNVARLVSSFRWRDGIYMVLEFGGKGDLHTAMGALASGAGTGSGALEEGAARFLLAEVVAALRAVHGLGFAYGDLKPENVLLVEDATGGIHAKLADFGACRPVSPAGAALVAASRRALRELRDGDWRAIQIQREQQQQQRAAEGDGGDASSVAAQSNGAPATVAAAGEEGQNDSGDDDEDDRVEGTAEYLSPELASGVEGGPSVASDAYALGVTAYQLLAGGRFPDVDVMWPQQQQAGSAVDADGGGGGRRVRFGRTSGSGDSNDSGFPPDFPPGAVSLVRQLLHPDPAQRLGGGPAGLDDVLEHEWFAAGLAPPLACPGDVDLLHARPGPRLPLPAPGAAGVGAGDAWSRRHNSTIWAPLPRTYTAFTSTLGSGSALDAAGGGARLRPSSSFAVAELARMEVLPPLV